MIAVGIMGAIGSGGGNGDKLHLLQLERGRWLPVCRLDDSMVEARVIENRECGDVTCKRCARFLPGRRGRK